VNNFFSNFVGQSQSRSFFCLQQRIGQNNKKLDNTTTNWKYQVANTTTNWIIQSQAESFMKKH